MNSIVKTTVLSLSLLVLIVFACKKQDVNQPTDELRTQNLRKTAEKLAGLHNKGMDYISSNFRTGSHKGDIVSVVDTSNGGSPAEIIYYDASNYLSTLSETNSITYTAEPYVIAKLDNLIANGDEELVKLEYNGAIAQINNYPILTSRENTMIASVTSIFNNAYTQNLTKEQTYVYLKAQLEALRDSYAGTILTENEGELFYGLLNIAMESNEYWVNDDLLLISKANENIISKKGNTIKAAFIPNPAFIQADCIGYIIGWGQAVMNDYNSGNLKPSGQTARISAGVFNALGWSSGAKFLRK